jgi:hypothetical protein
MISTPNLGSAPGETAMCTETAVTLWSPKLFQCKIINIMKELEIWFLKNNLIINTEKTFAMSFHSKQLRVLLRPKIVFKNTEIAYQSELKFLGINMTENLKWCAHARFFKAKLCKAVYMVKTLKETMSPYMITNIFQILSHV